MKKLVLAAALAVSTVSAAGAADLGSPNGYPTLPGYAAVKTETLTGIYLAAIGGVDFVNTEVGVDYADEGIAGNVFTFDGIGSTGVFGEAQLGFDRQIGQMVLGAFGGIGVSNAATDLSVYDGAFHGELAKDWHWLAGLRIGLKATKATMVYAGGGYTQADFEASADGLGKESETFSGWFGEIGAETQLSDNVYARVSGRYTAYGEKDYDLGNGYTLTVDPEDLRAMAGLVIKLKGKNW